MENVLQLENGAGDNEAKQIHRKQRGRVQSPNPECAECEKRHSGDKVGP